MLVDSEFKYDLEDLGFEKSFSDLNLDIEATYFDIKYDIFYGEIDWDHLVKKAESTVSFKKISKYPEVRRDLSLIIKKNVTYNKIKNKVKKLLKS
mgnify:CR=1 FL=1